MTAPSPSSPAARGLPLALAAFALLAVGVGFWFVNALREALPAPAPDVGPAASVLQVPLALPPFALTDHRGAAFGLDALRDHWSFLFFGYTSCPDVCPITLGVLRDARAELLTRGDQALPQFVFVSVDPERDGPARLAEFVSHFDADFVGVRGEPAQLARLTGSLGVVHQRAEVGAGGGYLVDHTAAVLLVDPEGQLRALFDDPNDPVAVADSFERIRELGPGR